MKIVLRINNLSSNLVYNDKVGLIKSFFLKVSSKKVKKTNKHSLHLIRIFVHRKSTEQKGKPPQKRLSQTQVDMPRPQKKGVERDTS